MKAITTRGLASNTHLQIADFKTPTPGAGDVLVRVHAASVNPKDWKLNFNLARLATPIGARFAGPVFGDDLAGEVVSVGRNVNTFKPGDRVYGMDMRPRTASLAEYAVISQRRISHLPAGLGFADAAAVPLAGQTALQGLRKGGAGLGSSVLIIGASGGVGTYAVQIARLLGCHVTAVCSTRNIELVEQLGADHVIDYTAGDYRESAGAFDMVFDVTSYENPARCAAMLKPQSHFVSTMGNGHALRGTLLARHSNASLVVVESYTRDLETMGDWLAAGQVTSVIDSTFSLAQAQQAYDRSRTRRARGKIVIEVAESG